jgi:glycosyltransferase involved in cell wall biosynthesis
MRAEQPFAPRLCFVGLANLPLLTREYGGLGVGGAELQQTLLARALVRRGLDVSMVVADLGQSDGAVWDGIKTYKAYRPRAGLPVLRFLHPRWTGLWAALKRANADIYYTSGAGAVTGQVALFARWHARKTVVRIASNSDCDPHALLIRYWRDKQLYRYGLQRADRVLAQTQEQQHDLLHNYGRDSRVVGSLTETHGRSPSFDARDLGVLWVGNLRPLKRPELLFETARRLPHLQFTMVGGRMPGHDELYESVRQQAQATANVRFLGSLPYHETGALYERARVFVGTSEIEGFPNTYLQAWGRGTPVVAFLDPEQLIARNGLGNAVADVEEMTAAIATLATEPVAWEAASERCRRHMESRFSESRMVDPYVAALAELSGAAQPARAG